MRERALAVLNIGLPTLSGVMMAGPVTERNALIADFQEVSWPGFSEGGVGGWGVGGMGSQL